MVKSAGIFKKLKNIFKTGAKWINNNIVKPLNPIIDTALDFIPGGGVAKTIKNSVSGFVDMIPGQTEENEDVQRYVQQGVDVLLDTQRSPNERRYLTGLRKHGIDAVPYGEGPRRVNYQRPFGQPMN